MKNILKIFLKTILHSYLFIFLSCSDKNEKVYKSNFWVDEQKLYWEELLKKDKKWYSSNDAIDIADIILVYQSPHGGWPKNIDYKNPPSFLNKLRLFISKMFKDSRYSYHPTIDNRSTYSQMRFLAKVYINTGDERFKHGFLSGFDYLISAQYDNGGWPQYYPLQGGYKNHVTFNDNAIIGVMEILKKVSEDQYHFIDSARIMQSKNAINKGVELILNTQIISKDKLSGWCSQYNLQLEPINARAFEPISICARESVAIIKYLMSLKNPNERIRAAIHKAVKWYDDIKINGLQIIESQQFENQQKFDIEIIIIPNQYSQNSYWARFYEIDTDYPIFSDRDQRIRYKMSELSRERRINYEWYGQWANKLILEDYPKWLEGLEN